MTSDERDAIAEIKAHLAQIDGYLQGVNRKTDAVAEFLVKIDSALQLVVDNITPTIDAIKKSPVGKMLGIK
jgi:ABC-type transporter Mla subunit MlaD